MVLDTNNTISNHAIASQALENQRFSRYQFLSKNIKNWHKNPKIIFVLVVLSWSTSWIVAKMQIGVVPVELSAGYRFFFAGLILLIYSFYKKLNFKFSKKEWQLIAVQGACVFSINHFFFLYAMYYISSGIVAALFSLSILLSAGFNFILYKTKTDIKIIIGGAIGIIGLGLVFANEVKNVGFNFDAFRGIIFCFIGVSLFSLSACITERQGPSKDLISKTSMAMIFGALISFIFIILRGQQFTFDFSFKYIFALTYLILVPGIIGFLGILYLISKIGGSKAGYTSLIYPVGALILSALFENYHFGYASILGLIMIISGNYLALRSKKN